MIPKHAIEAIDRMFRDICNVNTPFGGKIILLGGDFRQTLPVVRRARPAQIVEVCLKSSYIWPSVRVFHLRTNMTQQEKRRRNYVITTSAITSGRRRQAVDFATG